MTQTPKFRCRNCGYKKSIYDFENNENGDSECPKCGSTNLKAI